MVIVAIGLKLLANWSMRFVKSSGSISIRCLFLHRVLSNLCFRVCVAKRHQIQGWDLFNASFIVFSYGPTTKNLKILLLWRKQKGSAITRRFVVYDDRRGVFVSLLYTVPYSLLSWLQVIVTETKQSLSFWAQHVDSGKWKNVSCETDWFFSHRD